MLKHLAPPVADEDAGPSPTPTRHGMARIMKRKDALRVKKSSTQSRCHFLVVQTIGREG
jgi:hypothetical protein